MIYLVANRTPGPSRVERFRELLRLPQIVEMPGAHNAQAALQAQAAGFGSLYLSGAAMSASMGLPDLGIISVDDVCFFVRQIVRATDLPVLVDGDTGYGKVLNVMQTVRAFEDAGAAAIQLEDQILPKKCGHLNDKRLAKAEDMAGKVVAATKARREMLIVARTDAAASEGIDGAIDRARLYVEAGADVIFPEALTTPDMFQQFAEAVPVPLLANMTEFGRPPQLTAREFEALGYRIVIWPVSSLRVANKAQKQLYRQLRTHGSVGPMIERMQPATNCTRRSAITIIKNSTPRSRKASCRALRVEARRHRPAPASLGAPAATKGSVAMPLVDIHLVKGAWSLNQKQQMIRAATDALVGIWGEPVREKTWVRVLEVEDGQWGIAGEPFTVEDVKRLRGDADSA